MKVRVFAQEKYRHELKYICSESAMFIIESKISRTMKRDPYADLNGEYVIRSVYFDDYRHTCFFENEDGADPREKYRIRIYNQSADRISLERKRKKNSMTGKDVCIITPEICELMLSGDHKLIGSYMGYHTLLNDWIVQSRTGLLKPVMLGEYVRKPFVYHLGNVRITFDRNICASRQFDCLFDKDISRVAVLPTGYHILEVKWDDYLPDVIYQLIEDGHLQQSTFSKFYLGRKALGGNVYELW